jgi:hypothetical protein
LRVAAERKTGREQERERGRERARGREGERERERTVNLASRGVSAGSVDVLCVRDGGLHRLVLGHVNHLGGPSIRDPFVSEHSRHSVRRNEGWAPRCHQGTPLFQGITPGQGKGDRPGSPLAAA